MIDLRGKSDLGGADYGWLKAYHHFDVGLADGNRKHKPIGRLCVFNDDEIAAGRGFPTHTHRDLEIITYVREGTMVHRDSTGSSALIRAGDVQVMSAGSGIAHSETDCLRLGACKSFSNLD